MQPEFKDRPAFQVMGIQVRVNPASADWGDIWGRQFASREAEMRPFAADDAAYAVYFCADEEGMVDLLAGVAVKGVETVPGGLVLREVPAAREAVFTVTMEQIGQTWGRIYGEWLPGSGYQRDDASPDFERFPPGCDQGSEPLSTHVPIRRKA